jgi:PilZ domain
MNSPTYGEANQEFSTGRFEKRLPASVPIYLASLEEPRASERTSTENVSYHGARVISQHSWRSGEESIITPLTGEVPLVGRVIYCLRRKGDRFSLGVEFPNRTVKWTS